MRPAAIRRVKIDDDRRRGSLPGPVIHRVAPQSVRSAFVFGCDPAPAAACRRRRFCPPTSRSRRRRSCSGFSHQAARSIQCTNVERSRWMPWPASIWVWRCNGRCQANFDTAMCASSAAVGSPPSIGRGGAGACTTAALAGAAAVFRPADAFDPDDRRHDVQHLADVFADPMQLALAGVHVPDVSKVTLRNLSDFNWLAACPVTGAKPRGSVEFFVCPGSDEYDSLMTCPRPPIRPVCHVPSWKLWW